MPETIPTWKLVRARTPFALTDVSDNRQDTVPVIIRQNTPFGLNVYVFPFAPVEVSYSNIARQWKQIARPGDFAVIDDAGPDLIQAQMQFRISDRSSYGALPCEDQIEKLRLIGLWAVPVLITGMDSLISRPSLPAVNYFGAKFTFWNILDLGINVIRRNKFGEATQADVSLTIVENRNPNVEVVRLPFIDFSDVPPSAAGTPSPNGTGSSPSGISQVLNTPPPSGFSPGTGPIGTLGP